jgi:S-adenosylmethionine:tRNA ribosyltransferase-isomerase
LFSDAKYGFSFQFLHPLLIISTTGFTKFKFNTLIANRKELLTEQFDYLLPDQAIARFPLEDRDQSKLLVWRDGRIQHKKFTDVADELPSDALLIFNNTKVVPARLHFQKPTGAWIELLVVEKMEEESSKLNGSEWVWECMIGNKKKWADDEVLEVSKYIDGELFGLKAKFYDKENNLVRLSWFPEKLTFYEVLAQLGEMPIPPYLNRDSVESDKQNYQTVYAQVEGAIAAPTAGLHFTDRIFNDLRARSIEMKELTLHVGLGTFKPMKSEKVAEHEMHPEKVVVSKKLIQKLAKHTGPIVAVGTTSIRSLESLYWLGTEFIETEIFPEYLHSEDPYNWAKRDFSIQQVAKALVDWMAEKQMEELQFATQLYLMPGYQFRVVKGLITNFHQPKSTLLVLISAFIGDNWKQIYEEALAKNYRFLSYGDSSFLYNGN